MLKDISEYRLEGTFLINRERDSNALFRNEHEQLIELESSYAMHGFYELGRDCVLGYDLFWKSYHPSFLKIGHHPKPGEGPMSLWDAISGEKILTFKGMHYGEVRGASFLGDRQIITWGRDFLIHLWDLKSGEKVGTQPLMISQNAEGVPIVSSMRFGNLTPEEREDYVLLGRYPGFNVTIRIGTGEIMDEEILGPYEGPAPADYPIKTYEIPLGEERRLPAVFEELENAEAGYSTTLTMADKRIVTGGTTYGAWEHVYVWDRGCNLTILISSLNGGSNFRIDGEVCPNVIQVSDYGSTMIFEGV